MNIKPLVAAKLLKTYKVPISAFAGKDLGSFEAFSDLRSAVSAITEASYEGFLKWSKLPIKDKINILSAVEDQIKLKRLDITEAQCNIGISKSFADFNVNKSLATVQHYRGLIGTIHNTVPQSDSRLALVRRRPIGPVLSISAWNAPVILATRAIMSPLAAGCSVVLKGPERLPESVQLLVECFHKGGVPEETLQLLFSPVDAAPELTHRLISRPEIRKVNFTGSSRVARDIAGMAASNLKPYLLELGGKNNMIVQEDADITKAVESALTASWLNQGQICMATDKVYVHESIYDEFRLKLLARAEEISESFNSPLRDTESQGKVRFFVEDAVHRGAKVIFGSESNPDTPTILENVSESMILDKEEIFGPVFLLHKYNDIEDVVARINKGKYGLKVSIWSKDVLKATELAEELQIGGVHINSSTLNDEATTPHGGVKNSGTGRFNGIWGLEEFSYIQTTTID